ncbi:MAG: ABC transporter substrate-binding protein [Egibacteraceae bacterium]
MTATLLLDPVDELTRRELLVSGLSLAALFAASKTRPAAGAEPEGGAVPVTIEHKFGATEIPAEPRRVVAVGGSDLDALLALGVVPVATSRFAEEHLDAIFSWAKDEVGDAALPEVLDIYTDGVPFERVAALGPDLILAVYSAIEQGDYDRLSRIAPTVAQPKGFVDYGASWQLMTRTIGRAVGHPERAGQLVADVEAQLAQVRAAHPEFAGASGVMALDGGDGTYFYWPPPDQVGRFLADLGFEVPAELAELPEGTTRGQISAERVDLLDVDVLVWWYVDGESGRGQIRANPLYSGLDVATQGRDVFLYGTDLLNEAIGYPTVLSIPFLLDRLVPMLAAAVDGDPATEVTP